MYTLKSILAIVDPTQPAPQMAIDRAGMLAALSGARVELVVCDATTQHTLAASSAVHDRADRQRQTLLSDLAAPLRVMGIDVATLVISGAPRDELVSYVSRSTADLVVKGSHSHSVASRFLAHSTDSRLIQACPVPLLLAKPRTWSPDRIVMAAINPMGVVDPASRLDSAILAIASAFVTWLHGDLHIVHAYTPSAVPTRGTGFFGVPAVDAVDDACIERESRFDVLNRFIATRGVHYRQLHVDMGSTASYIRSKAIELQADVVAVGAGAPTSLGSPASGRMAQKIFDALECDVLLVRDRTVKHTEETGNDS
jgi:universal stress protein E